MNKKVLYILLGVMFLSAFSVLLFNSAEPSSVAAEQDLPKGPGGGREQFMKMRLGDLKEYPSGLYDLWYKNTLSKSSLDIIDSIKEIGPSNVGGRTRALLIDKLNINRILAGGISGGLWISENRGGTWSKVDDQSMNMNITAITQDPFEPANIYYGTGEGAGNSSNAPGAGIFKSTDGGNSFNRLPSTANANFEYCWRIKSSLKNQNEVYVSTNSKGLFRSKDGGASWTRIFVTTTPIHDIELYPDGSVMFGAQNLGIYRSYTGDSGTFFKATSGLPATGIGRIELAYCLSYPAVAYAAISGSSNTSLTGFYKTSDTGRTWVTRANPTSGGALAVPFTWYCLTMGVRDQDSNGIMLASQNICYSRDAGASWKGANNSHSDYHAIITHPSDTSNFLIGNDGGVYQYGWQSPTTAIISMNNGYNTTQFYHGAYAPTGTTIIGGTQDNGSHYSLNSAKAFKKLYGADGAYAQINQQTPTIAYVSTQNGNIQKTTNLNATTPSFGDIKNELDADNNGTIDEGAWFINPYIINLLDGSQLYYPTKRRLWRSFNGGETWENLTKLINVGSTQEVYTAALSNDETPTAYVGGSSGLLYRINNAITDIPGMEKSLRTSAPVDVKTGFISCIRVHPHYRNTIFLSLSNYSDKPRLWKVSNTDSAVPVWTNISGNLPAMLPVGSFDMHPSNPDSIIFAGTDFGLYVTNDGGVTWEKDSRIPNTVIDVVTIRPSDFKAFIFTHGRGAFVAHLKALPNVYASINTPFQKQLKLKVYPNPATEFISIDIPGVIANQFNVSIYNLEGKEMISTKLVENEKLNISNLPKGVYLIRARNQGLYYSAKFIRYE